ncbi:unnamed protein product [Ectocarpus sp. 4 AP-2014]
MTTNMPGDGARPKMITADGSKFEVATPTTLARLEDPRAWHARGEGGIQRPRPRPGSGGIALPMAPPLPKGRSVPLKKTVLEEEEYVDRLGEIIEGDYFPNNAKMYRALAGLADHGQDPTPSRTPAVGSMVGTPVTELRSIDESTDGNGRDLRVNGGDSEGPSSSKDAGNGGALTKFVATHTSEDNEAFTELQEKDQEAFRRRYFWAYDTTPDGEGNNATSTKLLILPNGKMMSVERREQMDAACADRPKIGDSRPNQVKTWKHRTRNQLMFSPNLAASNDICRIEQAPTEAAQLLVKDGSTSTAATTKRRVIKQSEEVVKKVVRATATSTKESADGDCSYSESSGAAAVTAVAVTEGGCSSSPSSDEALTATPYQPHQGEPENHSSGPPKAGGSTQRIEMDEPLHCPPGVDSNKGVDDFGSSESRTDEPPAPQRPAPPVSRGFAVVKANPKVIQAHATRFPVPAPRKPNRGPWASPIEKPSSSRESVAELLAGTADSSGYEEVPMTPSRVPGVDGDSPQITWGSIDGTPMILDPRATPLPEAGGGAMDVASFMETLGGVVGGVGQQQFEIKDLPARDKLAHRLEAVDTRRKRAKVGAGAAADGRGTHTPAPATPITPQTPGTGGRTPGTGKQTPRGRRTPAKGKGKEKAAAVTPAARSLAARLAQRQSADTPFGGGLTPGRQRRRTNCSGGGAGANRGGLTPLPASPAPAKGKSGAAEGKRSSLTDGLLTLK